MHKEDQRALARILSDCFAADELSAMVYDATVLKNRDNDTSDARDGMADALALAAAWREEADEDRAGRSSRA